MNKDRTTITLPKGLRHKAHSAGINISGIAASALSRAIGALEKETGALTAKSEAPATTSRRRVL